MRKTSGALLEAQHISGMSGVKLCASALAFARSTICSRNCIGVEVNDLMILKARIGSLTNGPGYKASPLARRATQVDCILLLVRVLLLVTSVGSISPAWVRLGSTCAEHMARSTAQHARPIHAGASTCRMACHIADTVERSLPEWKVSVSTYVSPALFCMANATAQLHRPKKARNLLRSRGRRGIRAGPLQMCRRMCH